jgi:hypothetical protein
MPEKRAIFSAIALLIAFVTLGQGNGTWNNIENAIRQKKNLVITTQRLQVMARDAWQGKDHIRYAHALNDLIRIRDLRTEDSLYFRNSQCIDSLLDDEHTPAELTILLHFMQARRLAAFTDHYLKFNRARYETPDLHHNYAALSKTDLDSITLWHFASVKKGMLPSLKGAAAEDVSWLSSNPRDFLFKPSFPDILMAEKIGYVGKRNAFPNITARTAAEWMHYPPDQFISILDSMRMRPGSALAGYGEWLSEECANLPAYYFIEGLARRILYQHYSNDTAVANSYEHYLLARIKGSMTEVKVYAVYQLCLLWNSKANNYPGSMYPPARALQLYEDNKYLFGNYPYLGSILETMRTEILSEKLQAIMKQASIPGEPILLQLQYKNTPRIWYRIIRQGQDDVLPSKKTDIMAYLLSSPAIREVNVELPLPADHASHRTFLKIDPLPAGRYSLLFADHEIGSDTGHLGWLTCRVSRMAVLSSDGHVDVLDRKTGRPLQGIALQVSYTRTQKDKRKQLYVHRGISDDKGAYTLPKKENYRIRAIMQGDTLDQGADATEDIIEDGYDPDVETPMEYYEDNARVAVFTDRAMYRPGQQVFFKAILMTKDLRSGDRILFNNAEINRGVFSRRLQTWLRKERPLLLIRDPFGRKLDSIPVRPNAYGSFSGSFRIPDQAATGEWHISPEILDEESGSGIFNVEEYKRPHFECKVQTPEKTFLPGEPLSFTLQVRTFTGAPPGNTRIRCTISRNDRILLDSSGLTDANGLLTVTALDMALQHTPIADSISWDGTYVLEATATDIAGESHEVRSSLQVSSRPVRIKMRVETAVSKDHWEPLLVTTHDPNGRTLSRDLQVIVYRQNKRFDPYTSDYSRETDQWAHPLDSLKVWFPTIQFEIPPKDDEEQPVYETHLNTGEFEKLDLHIADWQPGVYRISVRCREHGRLTGETSVNWTLFDPHSSQWPSREPHFFYLPYNYSRPGELLRFFAGSAFDSSYMLMQLKYYSNRYNRLRTVALFRQESRVQGVHQEQWQVPQDATGQVLLTWLMVRNNILYREERTVTINRERHTPRVIIEQFRDRLTPGEKAHFTLSVRTRERVVAAELLSTIYDASLDRLEKHAWQIPWERALRDLDMGWPRQLTEAGMDECFRYLRNVQAVDGDPVVALQGRVAGLSIVQVTGYEEVIGKGYYTTQRLNTGKVVLLRGASGWPSMDKRILIILDGVPYNGDISRIDIRTITDGVLLEGAEGTSLYGSRAGNGVLLLSTKGKLPLSQTPDDPPAKVRSHFNETAYFAPALYADKDGYYHFVFTMPESVTEWIWKVLAITKKAQFAYKERTFRTRLPLMIQPQLPRFFYQGDQVTISSRISNLDSVQLSGKVTCRIEDASTGEDLSSRLIRQAPSNFSLSAHSVTSAVLVLKVPQGQLHPLKLIFKASTSEYADAEAQILPVLSGRILLSRYQSFSVSGAGDTLLALPQLSPGDSLVGVGLSLDVRPQNAVINSLPWLATYWYDCAEQTFNKLLAECTALDLLRKDTAVQRAYDLSVRNAGEEKRQGMAYTDSAAEPPDLPVEKMTPWKSLTGRTKGQARDLMRLFDTAGSFLRVEAHLERLYRLQNPDGGLSWFEGGRSNSYISSYVLGGFGRLLDHTWKFSSSVIDRLDLFIEKLLRYGDEQFLETPDPWYVYARQYWREKKPPSARLGGAIRRLIAKEWERPGNNSLHGRALRIIISSNWLDKDDSLYVKIGDDLQQLYEEAINDGQSGFRWKAIADDDDLNYSTEETLALLIEAFQVSPKLTEVRSGILQWLLHNRTDHHWSSTKATAAIIGLLRQAGIDAVGAAGKLITIIGADTVKVSEEIMAGKQFAFTPAKSLPRTLSITRTDPGPASGHLGLYYFGSPGDVNDTSSFIHLKKYLYVYIDSARSWKLVDSERSLHIGDKVKTVLILQTARPLHFFFIRDQIASAMEPAEVHSGYAYEQGLYFYTSVRDTGEQFFFDFVPSGKWEISYESRISHAGNFTCGPASLECMYKPEVHAYSQPIRVLVE